MKHDVLSAPCTECGAAIGAPCAPVEVVEDRFFEEARQDELYYYAVSCALSALIRYAESRGRGWYHFADGALIAGAEILLS